MTTHLTQQQLQGYRQRKLSVGERIAINEHLAVCDLCYRRYSTMYSIPQASMLIAIDWASVSSPTHLEFDEEIVPYVEARVDAIGREIIESHLSMCDQCAHEVRELQQFRSQLENVTEVIASPPPHRPRRRGIADLWHAPVTWRSLVTAGLAASVVVMTLIALVVWQMKNTAQLASNNTSSTSTPANIPATVPLPSSPDAQEALPLNQPADQSKQEITVSSRIISHPKNDRRNSMRAQAKLRSTSPSLRITDDGRQVAPTHYGTIKGLALLTPELQRSVVAALRKGEVEGARDAVGLLRRMTGVTLKGLADEAEFDVISPVATAVRTDRPTFRWQPLPGAVSYTLTISDAQYNVVAISPSVTTTEWTITGGLKRDTIYYWEVSALVDGAEVIAPGAPSGLAKFKVIALDKAQRLQQATQTQLQSHLALGVLYAQQGLLDEAEREFNRAIEESPHSASVRQLLRGVQRLRSQDADVR